MSCMVAFERLWLLLLVAILAYYSFGYKLKPHDHSSGLLTRVWTNYTTPFS